MKLLFPFKTAIFLGLCVLFFFPTDVLAQQPTQPQPEPARKQWFERFGIRGYAQTRYNGLFETNPDLECEQCDKSWGDGGEFFMRRIRVIFFGNIHKRVFLYVQPDFASSIGSTLNLGQLRDAYIDVGLDDDNEFRFRIGQSKIPFGFENLQSSSRRLPLDRADGLNSALKNERDVGVMFYWAPKHIRERFRELGSAMKHSGDYGMLGFGVYNGQTANSPELNNNKHFVARFSYPFVVGSQVIEPSLQGYTGQFEIPASRLTQGIKFDPSRNYLDQRVAASFVLYPKPFGIQAEYNVGKGPEFNGIDSITVQDLHGGYATLTYRFQHKGQVFLPFLRAQYYDGGKKHEQDARSYTVRELELAVEWQPNPNFELVAMYTFSDRRFEDFAKPTNRQQGSLMRFQAQVNF